MHWTHSRYAKAGIENLGSDHYIHRVAREKDIMDTAQLILEYFERGGCITVGQYRKPRKEELTFRNDRGSAFNVGRKALTLRQQGIRAKPCA